MLLNFSKTYAVLILSVTVSILVGSGLNTKESQLEFLLRDNSRSPLEKIDAFSTESETLSALFCHIFCTVFFANSKNATKSKETSKLRQEMLNIFSALKFVISHLAFMNVKSVSA